MWCFFVVIKTHVYALRLMCAEHDMCIFSGETNNIIVIDASFSLFVCLSFSLCMD